MEAFHHVEIPVRHSIQVTHSEPALVVEFKTGGIDHQRVTFPMATRVPLPLVDLRREMRTPVEWNDPGLVIHFHRDGHDPAALHDLIVVVVGLRKHGRTGGAEQNAALAQKPVFGTVNGMQGLVRFERIISFLRLGREGRNSSVRRIHDQRRAHGL